MAARQLRRPPPQESGDGGARSDEAVAMQDRPHLASQHAPVRGRTPCETCCFASPPLWLLPVSFCCRRASSPRHSLLVLSGRLILCVLLLIHVSAGPIVLSADHGGDTRPGWGEVQKKCPSRPAPQSAHRRRRAAAPAPVPWRGCICGDASSEPRAALRAPSSKPKVAVAAPMATKTHRRVTTASTG